MELLAPEKIALFLKSIQNSLVTFLAGFQVRDFGLLVILSNVFSSCQISLILF